MRSHAKASFGRGLFGIACLTVLGLVAFLGSSAPSVGAAESFPGQGFLPDNRAWEMVSPPDKEGGEVSGNTMSTRASASGDAVQFMSLQAFADAIGTGYTTEYIAERSASAEPGDSGWATHAITPPQRSGTIVESGFGGITTNYEGSFSSDLSHGVFASPSPVVPSPNVESTSNLYLRDDLRTPGPGHYRLLTACPGCTKPLPEAARLQKIDLPGYAGASEDFSHLVFQSPFNLTADAPPQVSFLCEELPLGAGCEQRLYEWHDGELRYVGILPDGSAAVRSFSGQGPRHIPSFNLSVVYHPISADGSHVAFTVPPDSTDTVQGGARGELFSRIDGRSTIKLNASERAVPDSPQPARYQDASADHSRVFFTSKESLTENAPLDTQNKLYMWKRAGHDEVQHVEVDATGGSFTLTFNGNTTTPLDFDASAASVESALRDLVSVKPGNVSVSGSPGSYDVAFTGDFSGANVAEMSADGSGLNGGSETASVATTQPVENLTFVNLDGEPADGSNEVEGVIGASEDGRYLYFRAMGQLVPGKPVLGNHRGLYLWHDGDISYIGESTDFVSDDLRWFGSGEGITLFQLQVHVTPDGRHLLFWAKSGGGLLSAHGGTDVNHSGPGCPGGCAQFYVYGADTDSLQCASCRTDGSPSTAEVQGRGKFLAGASPFTNYQAASRFLSDDGRYAFFSTAEPLVAGDVNHRIDAYVFDTQTAQPHLLSSGRSPGESYFLDASGNGQDAFFITQERLSRWDIDSSYDLYDARVGGGFPEPTSPPPSCQGDACQPAPIQLNDATPSSSSFQGAGNERATARKKRRRCPQGKRRVKTKASAKGKQGTRCVKRKRHANHDRRSAR